MNSKELVKSFYESDFYKNPESLKEFIHPECELYWSSSTGFRKFNYQDILNHGDRVSKSFKELRTEISHLIAEGNFVTIRYTYYAVTLDHPEEEISFAHFISIWEIKDGKLYKCHEMSQMADELAIDSSAYLSMKFSK